MDSKIVS